MLRRIFLLWCLPVLVLLCPGLNAQGIDSLQNIHIVVTFSSPPTVYTVAKAPLRFNKLFSFSLQEDDGDKDIYTNAYPFLSGGTVNGVTYPGLKFTDGCGNDVFYKMSASIFPFTSSGSLLIDVHDPDGPYGSVNVTWPQLIQMYQQGWGVSNHGLTGGGGGTPAYEVARNTSYTKLKLVSAVSGGPDEKIFVNPNGGEVYSAPAWAQGYLVCYRDGYSFGNPSFNVSGSFPHSNLGMSRTNLYAAIDMGALVNQMAASSTGGAHQWGVGYTHSVTNANYGYSFTQFVNYMNTINATYGKTGQDNMWMATEEEVLEYLMVRDSITPVMQLSGNTLTISFTGSLSNKYRYYNSTILVTADKNISSVVLQGVQSGSYKGIGQSNGMVNFSWNGHYVVPAEVNAETWVSKTEATLSQEDANVAMDYVYLVSPGPAQKAYRIRLCQVPGIVLPSNFCTYHNAPVSRLPNAGGCPGHILTIPIAIDSFSNIQSFSQRIEYDPATMTFISGVAGKPSVLSGMTFTDQAVGGTSTLRKISIAWTGTTAKSLAVHDTLAVLSFNYIAGNTALSFNTTSNGGNDCAYVDNGGYSMYQYPTSSYFINGQVTNARLQAPGAITGTATLCAGTSGITYAVAPVSGASSYAWTFPAGFTVTQGANTDTLVVTAGTNAASGNISVRAVNVCTDNPVSPLFAVTVKPRPLPAITGLSTVCVYASGQVYSTEAGMTDYTWVVSAGGNISSGQGSNSIMVSWAAPGLQTISVTYRGVNGCMALNPTVKNVTVNPLPVPTITGSDTLCRTELYTYSANPGMQSYQWIVSPSGTIVSGGTTSTVVAKWDNTGPQWISMNCTNTLGCQAISPVIKNVFIRPIAQPVISGPDNLCEGVSGIVYSTQTGMTNYLWSISSGGVITSGAGTSAITVQWNNSGIQQLQVNYNLPGGCPAISPALVNVNVHARPQPHIYGPDGLCKGSTGVLFYTDGGMNNYQWTVSPGGIINSGAGTDSIHTSWNVSGLQSVTLTYINSFGCTPVAASVHNITVNPLPAPSIAGPSTVCNGSTGLIYSTQANKTNYSWTISPGGIITSGQGSNSIHVNWIATGLQQITTNYYDSNLCTAPSPATYAVNVFPIPSPSITGPSTACAGTNAVYSTQASMSGYLWTVSSGGSILSGQGSPTLTVKWNQAGTGTITVNYANSSGCYAINPAAVSVTVYAAPLPTITGPARTCMHTTVTFSTQTGMNNYTWTVSPGGSIISGNGTASVQVYWQNSGDQAISLTYANAQGCYPLQATQKNVRVHPLPDPVITGPATVCNLSSGIVYRTQAGKTNYFWTVTSGGQIASGQGTDSVKVNWLVTGFQHLTVTYLDSNLCSPIQPGTFLVTVNPVPNPTISGPVSACEGQSGINYTTQPGMNTYLWNISQGGTILSGLGSETIQVRWDSAGARFVSVNYANSSGCFALTPVIKNVSVYPLPAPTIAGPDSLCTNLTGTYVTESGMSGYQWVVSAGGSNVSGMGTNTIHVTWTTPGSRFVTVNYSNSYNCSAPAPTVFNVDVFPLPIPTITGNSSVCSNSSSEVYFTEGGMNSYIWSISSAGSIIAGQGTDSITVHWGNPGSAILSVNYTTNKGCTAVNPASKTITIHPLPVPVITGPNSTCMGSGPKTYSTQTGQLNYLWEISAGDSILSGQGTSTVSAQWVAAGNHWISVIYSSVSGCQAAAADTFYVSITPLPAAASAISGPVEICAPLLWQEYSVAPIANAIGYFWTLPAGAIFEGASNTNIVHVAYLSNAQQGNITVYGTNVCGNGSASSLFISVYPTPPTPVINLTPGNILTSSSVLGNQWHRNNQPLPGDTLDFLHVNVTGDYFTIVTIGNCVSDTSNIKYVIAVGIRANEGFDVNVYPNPTQGKLFIDFNNPYENLYKLVLIDELGITLYRNEKLVPEGRSTQVIDVENFPPGPVVLVIQTSQGIIRKKIIKK